MITFSLPPRACVPAEREDPERLVSPYGLGCHMGEALAHSLLSRFRLGTGTFRCDL